MQFNSYVFILAILPAFVVGYFVLNKISMAAGKVFLILLSIVFYIYGNQTFAFALGVSILFNLIVSVLISAADRYKKTLTVFAVSINIVFLLYYKYLNFFLENLNKISDKPFTIKGIALPLGISFFTFQQIMYVVSVYTGEIENMNISDYLLYILYFPKLIMGPLAEPSDLIAKFNDHKLKKPDWDNIASGLKIFSFGLFKKVVIADTFSSAVNWGFENMEMTTAGDVFLVMLFYTFEIYFDFSGYSDMAVGISDMVNIGLPCNFDSPYKALSIRDFWKRWHMSLTSFLTKYVYYPLGGSRKGNIRTYLNIIIVFLVSGLWHGANWTFLLWGGDSRVAAGL